MASMTSLFGSVGTNDDTCITSAPPPRKIAAAASPMTAKNQMVVLMRTVRRPRSLLACAAAKAFELAIPTPKSASENHPVSAENARRSAQMPNASAPSPAMSTGHHGDRHEDRPQVGGDRRSGVDDQPTLDEGAILPLTGLVGGRRLGHCGLGYGAAPVAWLPRN